MEFVSKKLCFFCDFSLTLWFLKMERAPSGEEKRNQHNEFMRIFVCFFYCDKNFLQKVLTKIFCHSDIRVGGSSKILRIL